MTNERYILNGIVDEAGGTSREVRVTGQVGRTLRALVEAGPRGITALEMGTWALRLSHYVFVLRHDHGLDIRTVYERHQGPAGDGQHGRYMLHSPVRLNCTSETASVA